MCMVTSATYTVANIPPIGSGEYEEVELHRQTPMNILLYNDSLQAETLWDVCLIAVLASITMLLHLVDMFIQKN